MYLVDCHFGSNLYHKTTQNSKLKFAERGWRGCHGGVKRLSVKDKKAKLPEIINIHKTN